MEDLYRVLEVARGASQRELKRAYRRLAKRHHPDRNPDDPTARKGFRGRSATSKAPAAADTYGALAGALLGALYVLLDAP